MGFVQLDMTKTKELDVAPEGEYELQCLSMDTEDASKKSGEPMISAAFKIADPNYPDVDVIRDWFMLPSPKDAEKDAEKGNPPGTTRDKKIRKIKRMLHAFGIPFTPDGFEAEDIIGEVTKMKVMVRQEPIVDRDTGKETGQMSNRANWPRYRNEEGDDQPSGKRTGGGARRR